MLKRARFSSSAGIALIEALAAMAILAATLLGLLYMQLHTVADTEGALRRTQALHLIDDLAERIRSNPDGVAQLSSYRSGWGAAPAPETDCEKQACGTAQLARWDLAQWKTNVARTLPQGDAVVFEPPGAGSGTSPRMLSVLVGWQTRSADSFDVTVPGATCPPGHACQFGQVQP